MTEKEAAGQLVDSGVAPMYLKYRPLLEIGNRAVSAFASDLMIHSLELGTLSPAQYQYVAGRGTQAGKLAVWQEGAVLRAAQTLAASKCAYLWISTYVPVKTAMKEDFLAGLLQRISRFAPGTAEHLCLAFGQDILMEPTAQVEKLLQGLKQAGIYTMLLEFGSEYCPVLRLNGLHFRYVVIDRELTEHKEKGPQIVSVAHMIKDSGAMIVFDEISREMERGDIFRGITGYYFPTYEVEEEKLFEQLVSAGKDGENSYEAH